MITTMIVPAIMTTTITLSSLLQDGIRYGTIVADPPWPERGGGKIKRGADRHYPLMKVRDIIAMGGIIQQLAKPNSHLYLWGTNNFLPDAVNMMEACGFRYVTMIT
jgi:N6-adenosine-specific RNA methylase IME4